IVKAARKLVVCFVDASRSEQISRSNDESAVSGEVVVIQHPAELLAQGCLRSRLDLDFARSGRVRSIFRDGVCEVNESSAFGRFASSRVQSRSPGAHLRSQCLDHWPARLHRMTDDAKCFPIAFFNDCRISSAAAALFAGFAAWDRHDVFW